MTTGSYPLGSGTEQGDYHFSDGIESALRHGSFSDTFHRFQGHRQDQTVVAPDFDVADPRAFRHRRRHWPGVDDPRDQFVAAGLWQQNPHRSVRHQRYATARATKHLRGADSLAFRKKQALLEISEAPLEQLLGVVRSLFGSA